VNVRYALRDRDRSNFSTFLAELLLAYSRYAKRFTDVSILLACRINGQIFDGCSYIGITRLLFLSASRCNVENVNEIFRRGSFPYFAIEIGQYKV